MINKWLVKKICYLTLPLPLFNKFFALCIFFLVTFTLSFYLSFTSYNDSIFYIFQRDFNSITTPINVKHWLNDGCNGTREMVEQCIKIIIIIIRGMRYGVNQKQKKKQS